MATSFADCCIRYGQEYVYTTFSQGTMTLGETYMSLAYGLIDPTCLPAMAIVRYDHKVWCTDTRRLTLSKELERRGKYDILQQMQVREVKQNTPEYREFVAHRIPAMYRKGLDGLTIKVSDRRGPTCCFNSDNRFRIDLEEHIVQDHLKNFTLEILKNLTVYYCNMCHTTTRIMCTKSKKREYYTIIRKCGCKPKHPFQFAQPWSRLTFVEMCNGFLQYKHGMQWKTNFQNTKTQSKNIDKEVGSTPTRTASVLVVSTHSSSIPDSQKIDNKATPTMIPTQPRNTTHYLIPHSVPEHNKPTSCARSRNDPERSVPSNTTPVIDTRITSVAREVQRTISNIHTTEVRNHSQERSNRTKSTDRHNSTQKLIRDPETTSKCHCIIS